MDFQLLAARVQCPSGLSCSIGTNPSRFLQTHKHQVCFPDAPPSTGHIKHLRLFKAPRPSDVRFPALRQRYHTDRGSLNGSGCHGNSPRLKRIKSEGWTAGKSGQRGTDADRDPCRHLVTGFPRTGICCDGGAGRSITALAQEEGGKAPPCGSHTARRFASHLVTDATFKVYWCDRERQTCH